jgi:hypothetical protein
MFRHGEDTRECAACGTILLPGEQACSICNQPVPSTSSDKVADTDPYPSPYSEHIPFTDESSLDPAPSSSIQEHLTTIQSSGTVEISQATSAQGKLAKHVIALIELLIACFLLLRGTMYLMAAMQSSESIGNSARYTQYMVRGSIFCMLGLVTLIICCVTKIKQ